VCECHGDVTNDGVVSAADLSLVLARWGTAVNAFGEADATHDGVINAADVSMVLAMWGTCPG
jgi:Ca2+-binding EF-hand superfamily protein